MEQGMNETIEMIKNTNDALSSLKDEIINMKDENDKLKKELAEAYKKIELLENHIKYMPNGDGYIEAKKHFEEYSNSIQPLSNEFYQNKLSHEEYMDYLKLEYDD
jgi:septal ring factor EnvC (AmiA/AmiB activator)